MGLSQRRKGTRGESEIVHAYAAQGFPAARVPNSGGLATKGDVVGVPGIHIECKRTERLDLWKALEQAESEAPSNTIPALHFRRNRSGWYVVLPLDDFIDMVRKTLL